MGKPCAERLTEYGRQVERPAFLARTKDPLMPNAALDGQVAHSYRESHLKRMLGLLSHIAFKPLAICFFTRKAIFH